MVQDDEVLAQLGRILESSVFANAARSKQFLEYCVNCSLRGDRSQLKETTIAVEVFLREASYDPKIDPIVRVHARRVREKLHLYYRTAGSRDPISIELPKGGYVPLFTRSEVAPLQEPRSLESAVTAPVLSVEALPLPIIEASSAPGDVALHRLRAPWLSWSGLALLVILVAALSFRNWRTSALHAAKLSTLQPLSLLPQGVTDASWSPDGKTVAYAQTDAQNHSTSVFVQDLKDSQGPRRLSVGGATEYRPVWSPNGRQVAFVRMLDDTHFQIIRHDLASAAEIPSRPFVTFFPLYVAHPALDWSPDGKSLLTAEQISPDVPVRLILLQIDTGERTYLTSPPIGSSGDIEAKFSPDGRLVAFRRGGQGDLYVVSASGEKDGKAERLTFDTRGVRGIAFVDGGQNVLFGTDRSGNESFSIYEISIHGGRAIPVTPEGFSAVNPSIVRPGLFSLEHTEMATQLVELKRNGEAATALLPSGGIDEQPAYAPHDDSVAFLSTRSGAEELWLYRHVGTAPEQLTHYNGDGFLFLPRWAPNGQAIIFGFRKDGATNVKLYDLVSRQLKSLTSTRSRDFSPVFSHDGKYIFYSSNEDGTSRLWRLAIDGHDPPEPLFTEAVSNFAPSPDGQWLYYLDGRKPLALCRLNLQDGTTQETLRVDARPMLTNSLVVTAEGIYLALSTDRKNEIAVYRVDPVSFQTKIAWILPGFGRTLVFPSQSFDITSDGQRLLSTRLVKYSSGLFLADNSH